MVADSRTRRNGRAIETIGKYHPKEEPSLIEVDSERAQYWLGVGAQPTEPVLNLLKITGDWQKFKGLPGAEALSASRRPSRPSWSCSSCARAGRERARRRGHHAQEEEGRQGRCRRASADAAESTEAAE